MVWCYYTEREEPTMSDRAKGLIFALLFSIVVWALVLALVF